MSSFWPMSPLTHDGWSSRKVIIGAVVWSSMFIFGTVALYQGRATFAEVVGLLQVMTPGVLVPMFAALASDKHAESKSAPPAAR